MFEMRRKWCAAEPRRKLSSYQANVSTERVSKYREASREIFEEGLLRWRTRGSRQLTEMSVKMRVSRYAI
jgi:hypothetical protein